MKKCRRILKITPPKNSSSLKVTVALFFNLPIESQMYLFTLLGSNYPLKSSGPLKKSIKEKLHDGKCNAVPTCQAFFCLCSLVCYGYRLSNIQKLNFLFHDMRPLCLKRL